MELKSCRVTISDMEGVAHTIEVTAGSLYEAVALGLKQIQGKEWGGRYRRRFERGVRFSQERTRRAQSKDVRIQKMARTARWQSRRYDTEAQSTRDLRYAELVLTLQE